MATSTQPSNQTNYDDPAIAQQAANMTKAIFQQESGTDYNATGDAGTSKGAGQWQPETWKAQAQDVLGDANAPMTQANQSVVAQGTIRKLIASGKNAAQIAAIWNSGSDENWQDKVGTTTINGQQIKYNVPQYVKSVTDLYQQYKIQSQQPTQSSDQSTQSSVQPTTDSNGYVTSLNLPQDTSGTPNTGTDQSLGQELQGRGKDISNAVSQTATGQINPLSGVIQGVGAVAGGIGDILGKGLELIPGVKQIEGVIGQGIDSFAQTPVGQSVVKSMQDFSTAHPELSADIGAGFNIITAIPVLKGFGLVKDAVLDGASMALKKSAQDITIKDLTKVVGDATQKSNIETLIKNDIIPTVENGKWSTDDATNSLAQKVADLGNKTSPNFNPAEAQKLADAGDVLTKIDKKPYTPGMFGKLVKHVAGVAGFGIGEGLSGNLTGGIAGGYVGEKAGQFAENKAGNLATGILKRAGQAGTKLTKDQLKKKIPMLFGGVIAHKVSKQ